MGIKTTAENAPAFLLDQILFNRSFRPPHFGFRFNCLLNASFNRPSNRRIKQRNRLFLNSFWFFFHVLRFVSVKNAQTSDRNYFLWDAQQCHPCDVKSFVCTNLALFSVNWIIFDGASVAAHSGAPFCVYLLVLYAFLISIVRPCMCTRAIS